MKTILVFALMLRFVPGVAFAQEQGTVTEIWEQRDSRGDYNYIYQVETETLIYDFLGKRPQAFRLGDSITFTFESDHRHALITCAQGKKVKLLLLLEGRKSAASNWNFERPSSVQNRPFYKGISVT